MQAHDVEANFSHCGDTSLPFYDALYRFGDGVADILPLDERSAVYMANGYARVSGKAGVCEGPSGDGAAYILPGAVEANESPVLIRAMTTDIVVGSRDKCICTRLDQEALFRPFSNRAG